MLLVLAFLAAFLPVGAPPVGPFWVSPAGSDSTGTGSQTNPWATPAKALSYIRANRLNQVLTADLIINLRAGTYSLANSGPISMTDADSGANGHQVIWKSYDGPGLAIFSGGVTVTGWTLQSGSTYTATIPHNAYTFYENGIRSNSARLPHRVSDGTHPCSYAPYFTAQSLTANLGQLAYTTSDFDPTAYTLADFQIVAWAGSIASGRQSDWHTDTTQVTAVNTSTHVLSATDQFKFYPYNSTLGVPVGSRYFIQGVKDNLSQGGEWYLDRSTNTLWYIARDGPIASQTIVAPQQMELLQIFGSAPSTAKNITIDGIAFQYTDFGSSFHWGYPDDTNTGTIFGPVPNPHILFSGSSADYFATRPQYAIGAVHLKNCDGVTIKNIHVSNVGMNGIYAEGVFRNNTLSGNWIEKVGLDGIRIDGAYPGYGNNSHDNTITNERVNNVGEMHGQGQGIVLWQSGNNTISYSYVHDGPRRAVWIFADDISAPNLSAIYALANTVDHVLAKNMMQDSGDAGSIGISSLSNAGSNTISQCIVDGTGANASMLDLPPSGVMMDDLTGSGGAFSNGQIMVNVQVTNTQSPGVQFRNNAGTHSYTNTSYNSDGSANGSFNVGLMDTANIGTTASFPYP